MWEGRCAAGATSLAVDWVQRAAVPSAREAGASAAEVFRSEDRVVLLTRWPSPTSWVEPVPDPAVVERCHAWPFESVADR
ncbi:MAG: hypothetical protein JWM02_975 [Frankiales bacterium]|nr:hypothetical protein [Frankiales bacterium]